MRAFVFLSLAMLSLRATAHADSGRIYISAGTGVSTSTYVHFYLEDSLGRKTGRLPSGERVGNIPGTAPDGDVGYAFDSVSDKDTGLPGPESVTFAADLADGHYKLVLIPLATTAYFLHVGLEYKNLSIAAAPQLNFAGLVTAGQPTAFEFDYAYEASTPAAVVKNVDFSTLRRDLRSFAGLGQVGDAKLVAQLDKILEQGEKALATNDASAPRQGDSAAEKLRQFMDKLEKAAAGKPDESAGKVKRVVTAQALAALGGDAKALIAKLPPGGKP